MVGALRADTASPKVGRSLENAGMSTACDRRSVSPMKQSNMIWKGKQVRKCAIVCRYAHEPIIPSFLKSARSSWNGIEDRLYRR